MINNDDCDVELPDPTEERSMRPNGSWAPASVSQSSALFLPIIQVVCTVSEMLKALKEPVLSTQVLHEFTVHFGNCMAGFPPLHQIESHDYLDPHYLPSLVYLQNARLIMHRHNLSMLCVRSVRAAAVDYCVIAAEDTVRLISRCMQDPPELPSQPPSFDTWQTRLMSAASTILCTHLWRCALFLCFRSKWGAALVCTQASAIIGSARPINIACGKYLDFFVQLLAARTDQGQGDERNEELVAYVSGDLQGSLENSWIWQGGEAEVELAQFQRSRGVGELGQPDEGMTLPPLHAISEEPKDWRGWDGVIATLQRLQQDQQPDEQYPRTGRGMPPQMQGHVRNLAAPINMRNPEDSPDSSSRIRIANII